MAAGPLAEGPEVHVVLEGHVGPELPVDLLHQALTAPAREVGGHPDDPPVRVEHAGAPHRRVRDVPPPDPGVPGQVVRHLPDLPDERGRAPHPGALVPAGHDRPRDVGDRGPDPLAADVDPDDPPGLGVQLVQDRRGALPTARSPHLPDEPGMEEGPERQRDRRLRQARLPGHLRTGQGAAVMDDLEHGPLVDRPQEAWRPGGHAPLRAGRRKLPPSDLVVRLVRRCVRHGGQRALLVAVIVRKLSCSRA